MKLYKTILATVLQRAHRYTYNFHHKLRVSHTPVINQDSQFPVFVGSNHAFCGYWTPSYFVQLLREGAGRVPYVPHVFGVSGGTRVTMSSRHC